MHPLDAHLRVRVSRAFSQRVPCGYPLHLGRSQAILKVPSSISEVCASFRGCVPHFGGLRLIPSYLRGHALHCRHVVDDSDGSTRYIPFLSPSGWSGAGATAAR